MLQNSADCVVFIGCGVLGPDIKHAAEELGVGMKKKMLEGGLHNTPVLLKKKLQEAIDEAASCPDCRRIIVGYGLCGKGTVGIQARRVPLIFPKVHDCIALFMGSDREYKRQFSKYPGTYYLSSGWYLGHQKQKKDGEERVWIGDRSMGCSEIKKRYGEKGGGNIIGFFSSWQSNYQRAAFIDTGLRSSEKHAEHARKMAEKYKWKYDRIPGNHKLLRCLLKAEKSERDILVVPPGHVTYYSAVDNGLAAAKPEQLSVHSGYSSKKLFIGNDDDRQLSLQYGLGIDAGGTYTDAAIWDFKEGALKCKNKALTTRWDFSLGIDQALCGLDESLLHQVGLVSVSTTLATNAIVEGDDERAGLLLMPGPGGIDDTMISHEPMIRIDGRMSISGKELQKVDPGEVRSAAQLLIKRHGVTSFAVSGFGGSVNPDHELEIKSILEEETGMAVCCGHELSDLLNFIVRAQTAVLNARIIPRMLKFFRELKLVLEKRNIITPLMVVKGDGTLISEKLALERPVETILSGPAASVAGARLLTGLDDAVIVDIGGTTTDTADLGKGEVEVCESGARVGGIATHVKALNMRSIGLGGDSQILWKKGKLELGPRRVAPLVMADCQSAEGLEEAFQYMERTDLDRTNSDLSQTILMAVEGEFPFQPTKGEEQLYKLLRSRPHCLEELTAPMNLASIRFLDLERLEGCGLVIRCGLTPTDILHQTGRFVQWPVAPAHRMMNILSSLLRTGVGDLADMVVKRFEWDLAKEILKKQLSKDVDIDGQEECRLSAHMMNAIISGEGKNYVMSVRLQNPIVGIGAPSGYFLPGAAKKLGGKVVIPENADVANALGAITSHILVKRHVSIQAANSFGFIVRGVPGRKQFNKIEDAEQWAVDYLKGKVREIALEAGTSSRSVAIKIEDRTVGSADGTPLFLERVLSATLTGIPDVMLKPEVLMRN